MYIVININTNKIRKPDSIFVESGFVYYIEFIYIKYIGVDLRLFDSENRVFGGFQVFLNQSYILSMKTLPN